MPYDSKIWKAHPLYLKQSDKLAQHIYQRAESLGLSVQKYLLLLARYEMQARSGDVSGVMALSPVAPKTIPTSDDDNALSDMLMETL